MDDDHEQSGLSNDTRSGSRATSGCLLIGLIAAAIVLGPGTESATTIASTARSSCCESARVSGTENRFPHPVAAPPLQPLTAIEMEVVEWARGQFRTAGLILPAVEIAFSADADDCVGEQGVYRRSAGAHSVTVCVPDREGAAIDHRRRRTLLHELAHAWDHAALTDVDRERLLPVLDATDWYDPGAAWDQRGVERLAETLTWGLLDQKRRPLKIESHCAETHLDFITITGSDVLGPIDQICEIDLALRGSSTQRTEPGSGDQAAESKP